MNTLNARPKLLKQANLSLIRSVIKSNHTATRAEIVTETKISSTTVRTLLSEMMQNDEIESIGCDESSGGRKAERYRFKPDRYYGAAFCIADTGIYHLLVNVCGEIIETKKLEDSSGNFEQVIITCLDELTQQKELKSIGVGVSGVVDGGSYWKKSLTDEKLHKSDFGTALSKQYGIPVVLENNLNATAIGFRQCYEKTYPDENPEQTNMAYLHLDKGCIGAGFIAGGRIIRGFHNFAGELGLIPADNGKLLDEFLAEPLNDKQYTQLIIKIIGWICGILNPQYVTLSGPGIRENCIASVNDLLSSLLPPHMAAEILYSPDMLHDYFEGMACLTSDKMFNDVLFIKE